MTVSEFLNSQEPERKKLLSALHKIILESNPLLKVKIGEMMRQEMIMYEIEGAFMYALASGKSHMSLHNMILYSNASVHAKYTKLFNKAKLQKGCVNFANAEQIPLDIAKTFMADCAKAAPEYLEMYKARMKKRK